MKTIQTKVFEFSELSDKAKEKAREWYRSHALDYEWWDSTYDDAGNIGLKITGFDLDRNRHATGSFTKTEQQAALLIVQSHGKDCETFKTAKKFLDAVEQSPETTDETQDAWNELCAEFLKSILEDYSIMLQKEMEYLLSDEAVDGSIAANEYTFTETGKRFG